MLKKFLTKRYRWSLNANKNKESIFFKRSIKERLETLPNKYKFFLKRINLDSEYKANLDKK